MNPTTWVSSESHEEAVEKAATKGFIVGLAIGFLLGGQVVVTILSLMWA